MELLINNNNNKNEIGGQIYLNAFVFSVTLYCDGVPKDILLTISNFANTCRLLTLTLPVY